MADYYGFAAFFCQTGTKGAEDYREKIIFDKRGGEVKHPVGGAVMAAYRCGMYDESNAEVDPVFLREVSSTSPPGRQWCR